MAKADNTTNVNIIKMIEYPKQGIISKDIFKSKSSQTGLYCMAKGAEMSEHTSSREGVVYVLEGKGVFVLQGKKIKMEKGVLIHMKSNAKHSLKADENTAFMLTLD